MKHLHQSLKGKHPSAVDSANMVDSVMTEESGEEKHHQVIVTEEQVLKQLKLFPP